MTEPAGARPAAPAPGPPAASGRPEVDAAPVAHRVTVDDMGEWSFPASDPPATWTWEPGAEPRR